MDNNKDKKDKTDNTGEKFDKAFDNNFNDTGDKDKKNESSDDVLILDDTFKSVEDDEYAGDLFGSEGDATVIQELSIKKDDMRKANEVSESGIDIYKQKEKEKNQENKIQDEIEVEQLDNVNEIEGADVIEFGEEEYHGVEENLIELDFPAENSEADFKHLEDLFEEKSPDMDRLKSDTAEPVPQKGDPVEEEISTGSEELNFSKDSFDGDIENSDDKIPQIIDDTDYQAAVKDPPPQEEIESTQIPLMSDELIETEGSQDKEVGEFIVENNTSFDGLAKEPQDPKKIIESKSELEDLVSDKRPPIPKFIPEGDVDIHNLEPEAQIPESPEPPDKKSFRIDDEPKKAFLNIDDNLTEKLKIPGIIAGIVAIIAIVYFVVIKGSGGETNVIKDDPGKSAKIEQWRENRLKQKTEKKSLQTVTTQKKIQAKDQEKGKEKTVGNQKGAKTVTKKRAQKTETAAIMEKTGDKKTEKAQKPDEEELFERIQQEDTLEGYKNYIRQYREGKFRRDAIIRIRFLEKKQEQDIVTDILAKTKQFSKKKYRNRFKQFSENELPGIRNTVRGYTGRFEKITIKGQNVLVDYISGLMWHLWENPVDYSRVNIWKARRYAGYMNWNVPTAEEALTLSYRELEALLETKPKIYRIWTGDMNATPTSKGRILCVDLKTKKVSFVPDKSFNYLFCCRRIIR